MKNKISDLNNHLFESIEMLKNNSDPEASPNERMDIATAKQIAELGKVIVDGAKVQVQALELLKDAENPSATQKAINDSGIIDITESQKAIGQSAH